MRKLNGNIILKIGIISYSICVFFLYTNLYSSDPGVDRDYEIQLFAYRMDKQLDYIQLKKIGIKKIIYRVFKDEETNGGLYFINTQFRVLEPALEQIIAEFDFKKFDLCAWMIARNFKWIETPLLFDCQYENSNRQVIRRLDVFNPDAVKKLITVYKELASHKIDCILIQDDFTLRFNEGFSTWGKGKFTGATGVPAREDLMMQKNTPYNLSWNRVKMNQLNTVLKQVVQGCKSVNSGIKVGINIYYETPLYEDRSEAWYGHNLSEILKTGVDYIYLMSYHRQIKDELRLSDLRNRDFFEEMVDKAYQICKEKLIVKIQTRDWETSERIPVDEIRAYLKLIPSQVKRVCFTPVTSDDFDYLKELLAELGEHSKRYEESGAK